MLFACGGWQMLCYVAPQVRDPARKLPRAILFGVLGVVAVYLAVNAAYVYVLGIDGIAANPQFASETARRVFGDTGALVLRAAMAVSALGVCVVTVIVTPWLYVAMAKEGLFFSRFARLSPSTTAWTVVRPTSSAPPDHATRRTPRTAADASTARTSRTTRTPTSVRT